MGRDHFLCLAVSVLERSASYLQQILGKCGMIYGVVEAVRRRKVGKSGRRWRPSIRDGYQAKLMEVVFPRTAPGEKSD